MPMPQNIEEILDALMESTDARYKGENMPIADLPEDSGHFAMPTIDPYERPAGEARWQTRPYEEISAGGLDALMEAFGGLRSRVMAKSRSSNMPEISPDYESNMPIVDPQEHMTPAVRGAEDIPPNILQALYERSV